MIFCGFVQLFFALYSAKLLSAHRADSKYCFRKNKHLMFTYCSRFVLRIATFDRLHAPTRRFYLAEGYPLPSEL